jgi:hypothetical protein
MTGIILTVNIAQYRNNVVLVRMDTPNGLSSHILKEEIIAEVTKSYNDMIIDRLVLLIMIALLIIVGIIMDSTK